MILELEIDTNPPAGSLHLRNVSLTKSKKVLAGLKTALLKDTFQAKWYLSCMYTPSGSRLSFCKAKALSYLILSDLSSSKKNFSLISLVELSSNRGSLLFDGPTSLSMGWKA